MHKASPDMEPRVGGGAGFGGGGEAPSEFQRLRHPPTRSLTHMHWALGAGEGGAVCACVCLSSDEMLHDLHKFILLVGAHVDTQTRLQGSPWSRAALPWAAFHLPWEALSTRAPRSRAPCLPRPWTIRSSVHFCLSPASQ